MDDDYDFIEEYIDRCVRDAINLKESIELGMYNIENDPKIVKNPNSEQYIDIEKLLELRSKSECSFFAVILCFFLFL